MKTRIYKAVLNTGFLFIVLAISISCSDDSLQDSDNRLLAEPFIYDNAGLLNEEEANSIRTMLYGHNINGPGKVSLFTIKELPNQTSIESYAAELVKGYSIADNYKTNHVLLLIALKDKKVRIETDNAVSGKLTDEYCRKIIKEIIAPEFTKNNYFKGINAGLNAIIRKLSE